MSIENPNLEALLKEGADAQSVEHLFRIVYGELRQIAATALSQERTGHTLVPTALVHEAYLKLMQQRTVGWANQTQFLGVAAKAMRQILTDYARMKKTAKRNQPKDAAPIDSIVVEWEDQALDLVALDEALSELAEMDERKARVIELRFFAGLTARQAADVLNIPLRTINRDWSAARAWLYARLTIH